MGQIREAWPEVKIIIRADSGFCRDDLMSWCEENEKNRIDYVLGLAKNERLKKEIAEEMKQAEARFILKLNSHRECSKTFVIKH